MVFAAAIATLLLYFIRPQDWVPGLEGVNVVKPVIAMAVFGLMSRKRGNMAAGPLPFFKTPHEWLMVVYLGYILVTSPDPGGIMMDVIALGSFFFITLHAISSARLLQRFLRWWSWALLGVVVMGLGALFGFDFTQSAHLAADMDGRLCLRHWMLDNPNSLGHTLSTLLPLLYFGMFKGRPAGSKVMACVLALLTGVCLWHTQSKGAYLVGAGSMLIAVILGRPWWIKVGVVALALGGGQAVLSTLPRMNELGSLKSDEGVVGRLMAWEIARNVTRNTLTGEGWKRFAAVIRWEGENVDKATHSSYVKVGADLGIPGLLLYLSLLCTAARTLLTFQGPDRLMERLKNVLLCLLFCYVASSWMIDRAYHTEFFMLMGAVAAYHGLCVRAVSMAKVQQARERIPDLRPPVSSLTFRGQRSPRRQPLWLRKMMRWRTYGVTDAVLATCALQAVLGTWDYVLQNL